MNDAAHESIRRYITDLFAPPDPTLDSILHHSAENGLPEIHIQPEEGRLIQFLLRAVGARRVIEVGTLGGYSGVWIARALPADGRLITLDMNPDHAALARRMFDQAGLDGRVEVRLGQAADSLKALAADGPYDAMFIDANKDGYPDYLEWAIQHVRPGGLILAHNALFGGSVVGLNQREEHLVQGLQTFNQRLASDPRLFGTIIAVGDGLAAALRV